MDGFVERDSCGVTPSSLFASVSRVLCIGAHPDDIEIGSGGTVRAIRAAQPNVDVHFVVMTASQERAAEARSSAERYLGDAGRVTIHGFRDGALPFDDPGSVKAALVEHRAGFVPDLVLSPWSGDAHQDHRFLGELAWQVYRDQVVLQYEIPKYEGDLRDPNVYVAMTAAEINRKITDLHECFLSQTSKPWFDDELFRGLMRLRGVEANVSYAEAFHAAKLILT